MPSLSSEITEIQNEQKTCVSIKSISKTLLDELNIKISNPEVRKVKKFYQLAIHVITTTEKVADGEYNISTVTYHPLYKFLFTKEEQDYHQEFHIYPTKESFVSKLRQMNIQMFGQILNL